MLPGVAIAFPGGGLTRRFGDKAMCTAGLALMIAGGGVMGLAPAPAARTSRQLLALVGRRSASVHERTCITVIFRCFQIVETRWSHTGYPVQDTRFG